jgi:2-iminobutanoate/2-iminopropanoate deaminase
MADTADSNVRTRGGWIFISGLTPYEQDGKVGYEADVAAQTVAILENLTAKLKEHEADRTDVLKCNVYLADIRSFQAMNDVFARYFPDAPPARTTVEARLPDPGQLVEISAVAFARSE